MSRIRFQIRLWHLLLVLTLVACLLAYSMRLKDHALRQHNFIAQHEGVFVFYHELESKPSEALSDSEVERISSQRINPKREWPGPAWLRGYFGDEAFATIAQAYVFRPRDKNTKIAEFDTGENLKLLHISGWSNLAKITGFENLQELEVLNIGCCNNLKDYASIAKLKQLRQVSLSGCHWMTEMPFEGLNQLERISIAHAPKLANYSQLDSLPKLGTLDLNRVGSLNFSASGSNNVTNMTIRMCPTPTVEGLSTFQSLKKLTVIACPLDDITELGSLKTLQELSISSSYALADFSPLGNLTRLKQLSLQRNPGLSNLEFVKNLSRLKSLNISECKGLKRWDAVFELKQLELLDVSRCKNIKQEDVDELKRQLPNTEIKYHFR